MVEKDVFHYLFDFGDDWWHRIRVQAIKESGNKRKSIKIIKISGHSQPNILKTMIFMMMIMNRVVSSLPAALPATAILVAQMSGNIAISGLGFPLVFPGQLSLAILC